MLRTSSGMSFVSPWEAKFADDTTILAKDEWVEHTQ